MHTLNGMYYHKWLLLDKIQKELQNLNKNTFFNYKLKGLEGDVQKN